MQGAPARRLVVIAALLVVLVGGASPGGATTVGVSATKATAIAAGLGQSCAVTGTGAVKCWGANGHAELGDGGTTERLTPVAVSGLGRRVTAIAAGARHACALTRDGGVKCWGNNSNGTLGDGTTSRHLTPVDVAGMGSLVTALAAGLDHTCALTSAGGVKCWGYNRFGELGDGTTDHRWTPVAVSGLTGGVAAIAAGGFHSCAVTSGGGVKCWGGPPGNRLTPVDVAELGSGITKIAVGSSAHGCALTSGGGVKCWGSNGYGQLGDGTTSSRPTPVDVFGLSSGVAAIAAGAGTSCALTRAGGVKCWGRNDFGQLGDGTSDNRSTPVDVSGLKSGVIAIGAGVFHSCAVTRSGGVKCWGLNGSHQLGDRTTVNRRTPVGVIGFGAAKALLAIVSRSVTVTRGRIAAVTMRCGSQTRCRGTVTFTAARMRLGSRAFSIAAGKRHTVNLELTSRGFTLLVRLKRLRTRAVVKYEQPDGGTTTTSRTITLNAP